MVSAFAGQSIPASSRRPVVAMRRRATRPGPDNSASGVGARIALVTEGVLHPGEKRPLPVTPRHFGVKRRGELLEELALLRGQLLWCDHLDGDDLVPAICTTDRWRAPPLQAELLTALSTLGQPERDRPVDGLDLQLIAKRRLRYVDPYLMEDRAVFAGEERVGRHDDAHVGV